MSFHVLLFSKYSTACQRLFSSFQQASINPNNLGIEYVCVDNKNVRNMIKNSKTINITSVPCLLIIQGDQIQKYENQEVFGWFNAAIQSIKPKPQPHSQPRPQQVRENYPNSESVEPSPRSSSQPKKPKPQQQGGTSINDIPFDDNQEDDRLRLVKQPPRIKTDASGSYVEDQKMFQGEPDHERQTSVTSAVREQISQTKPQGPDSITSRIQAIERERKIIENEQSKKQ